MSRSWAADQYGRLRKWRTRMAAYFVATLLVVTAAGPGSVGDSFRAVASASWWVLLVIAVPGVFQQLSGRCPSCADRLGLQTRLDFPRGTGDAGSRSSRPTPPRRKPAANAGEIDSEPRCRLHVPGRTAAPAG